MTQPYIFSCSAKGELVFYCMSAHFCACRELAIQLRRDVKPSLDAAGIKLFLVSIGTKERSNEFAGVHFTLPHQQQQQHTPSRKLQRTSRALFLVNSMGMTATCTCTHVCVLDECGTYIAVEAEYKGKTDFKLFFAALDVS